MQVLCYTFGAPRTGNAAFAELYNRTVSDTWMLINGQVWHLSVSPCRCSVTWMTPHPFRPGVWGGILAGIRPSRWKALTTALMTSRGNMHPRWVVPCANYIISASLAQDAVPRSGKFWKLYSRPGHMCVINSMGDLIVRPSFVVQPLPAAVRCTCCMLS